MVSKNASCPPRSRRNVFWSRPLRFGLKNCTVSALVWKIAPSPLWSRKPRRIHTGCKEKLAGKNAQSLPCLESFAVSNLVRKVAPSPRWSQKSRRIHIDCKEILLGRAVSVLVWKAAPELPWSGKLNCLYHGLESRAASLLVWKVAPSSPWSGKLRRLRPCLRNIFLSRAASALVWKVAPSLPCSEKLRRLHLVRESLEIATFVRAGNAGRAFAFWVAPFLLVAPSPIWSRKSGKLRFVLYSITYFFAK